jgi:hypothetical protein
MKIPVATGRNPFYPLSRTQAEGVWLFKDY